ncbi:MAG: heavy metal-binding domain-containing protein [Caulobacteraceae bacterium]
MLVATTNGVAGYRVVQHLGMVRGITVRSRSVVGNLGGAIQSVFGGNLVCRSTPPWRRRRDRRPTT